jgi:pimeloyl-ACP methyl ester carboxylesterase
VTAPVYGAFTPAHRAGSGPPLVCLHGFMDTWRIWELVLPALERRHDVLAPTLPGHAGGPPLPDALTDAALADGLERVMDQAGLERAHLVGSSLGGYVALQLASRGRARSVVALAPAGGWARGDNSHRELLDLQRALVGDARAAVPFADSILASAQGRRRATELTTTSFEHIPAELLVHQLVGVATCPAAETLLDHGRRAEWAIDAAAIDCPVRIVWGTADRLLPWPRAAARYRTEWLPHADWVVLDDVGHYPQLDVPAVTAELILGFTATAADGA